MERQVEANRNAVQLEIGDLRWRAVAGSPGLEFALGAPMRPFAVAGQERPDLDLTVSVGQPEIPRDAVLRFASSGLWRLYTAGNRPCLTFAYPGTEACYEVVCLDETMSHGELLVHPSLASGAFDPWEYPFSELLMILQLAEGRGVLLHAGALVDGEEALLFVGESGAGKSTMTRLWAGSGVRFLSDDRAIVRRWGTTHWAYGTPWHGEAGVASPGKAPLGKLLFLNKAPRHALRALSPREALTRLVVNCFPTFWDPEGMAFTLDFLADMVCTVPCYELSFAKDPGVIDLVRSIG